MEHHFDKAHNSEVPYMAYRLTSHFPHGITTPKTELGIGVFAQEGTHEVGSMKVARGFASYDVVSHNLQITGMSLVELQEWVESRQQ